MQACTNYLVCRRFLPDEPPIPMDGSGRLYCSDDCLPQRAAPTSRHQGLLLTCPVDGTTYPLIGKGSAFCSPRCRVAAFRAGDVVRTYTCLYPPCGRSFTKTTGKFQKFCSQACNSADRRAARTPLLMPSVQVVGAVERLLATDPFLSTVHMVHVLHCDPTVAEEVIRRYHARQPWRTRRSLMRRRARLEERQVRRDARLAGLSPTERQARAALLAPLPTIEDYLESYA